MATFLDPSCPPSPATSRRLLQVTVGYWPEGWSNKRRYLRGVGEAGGDGEGRCGAGFGKSRALAFRAGTVDFKEAEPGAGDMMGGLSGTAQAADDRSRIRAFVRMPGGSPLCTYFIPILPFHAPPLQR